MQPATPSKSMTPLADMQEPTIQRLEAQLPDSGGLVIVDGVLEADEEEAS